MLIDAIEEILSKCKSVRGLEVSLDSGESPVFSAPPAVRSLLTAALFVRNPRPMLVVISGEDAARRFSMGLGLYLGRERAMHYPSLPQMPWSDRDPDPATVGQRLRALSALRTGEPVVVVASTRSLMRLLPPASSMMLEPMGFTVGEEVDGLEYEQIPEALVRLGYTRADIASERGTFSVHGDSMDVFGSDSNAPVRIGFFGDEVDTIRRIVPSTGQTICDLESARIYPAREIVAGKPEVKRARTKLNTAGLLTYEIDAELEAIAATGVHGSQAQFMPFLFNGSSTPIDIASPDTLTLLIEPRSLFDDATRGYEELQKAAGEASTSLEGLFSSPQEMRFDRGQVLSILSLMTSGASTNGELRATRAKSTPSPEKFAAQSRGFISRGYTVVLGVSDRQLREELMTELTDEHVPIAQRDREKPQLDANVVNIIDAPISIPLVIPEARLALLNADEAITGLSENSATSRSDATRISFPYKPGDYVVHSRHGIAHFTGMDRQEVDGIWRDYLVLEYAAGDKLFIPVEQMSKITKYVGAKDVEPRLTRLNTNDWSRARQRASKAARKLAFDLVDLYVRRSAVQGHAYSPDNEMQREMEEMFPYEETSDQARAIADVKADMESPRPMDRLICGDVGFGKTEVAIRAAFKAVQDGMQVMVLCPTTILAQQHYTTFSERFEPFPVTVDILSRFRTDAQQKRTLDGFSDGSVDILIGTHRLLSHDVSPKRLGLVIIDEEQRFGVAHKEQMKNLREHIDVLTLTATPIPRTLQMSLGGIRDMSLINTAPTHRIPVETYVGEWDDDIVGGAIRREIERGGQVYFISSRIRNIDEATEKILESVPEARVGFAHGRMGETALENVMESFSAGEIDVLVSTTIVESGIDNPHTNTLIIADSHMLGLAQLYQLKGRVGRSSVQAYAYFMFPRDITLTQEAIDRLVAIKENQELGSGIKIAMRDLEIRGAGSLLGAEQSGNISAIGFEAFMSMLTEYVDEARGATRAKMVSDTLIDVPVEAFIPEEFVPDTADRVEIYRQFAIARDAGDLERIKSRLREEFGELPDEVVRLFARSHVQMAMRELGIESAVASREKVTLEPVELDAMQRQAVSDSGATYFTKTHKMIVRPADMSQALETILFVLNAIISADEQFKTSGSDTTGHGGREKLI